MRFFVDIRQLIKKSLVFKDCVVPNLAYFIVGVVLIVITSVSYIIFSDYAGFLLDMMSNTNFESSHIKRSGIIVLLMLLVNSLSKLFQNYCFFLFSEKSLIHIREKIFYRLLCKNFTFYDNNKVGNIISLVNVDVNAIRMALSSNIVNLLYRPLVIILSIISMLAVQTVLTVFIISVIPLMLLVVSKLVLKIKFFSKKVLEDYSMSNMILQESLNLVRTIKIFCREYYESLRFNDSMNNIMNHILKMKSTSLLLQIVITMFSLLCIGGVILFALNLIVTNRLSSGELMTFVLLTFLVMNSISAMSSSFANVQQSLSAVERVAELINSENEEYRELRKKDEATQTIKFCNEILFKNVTFSYPSRENTKIYDNLNLRISRGDRIGVVGASGSGKTTFVQVLLGLYPINGGHIIMDGVDIKNLDLSSYRRMFAYIPQDIKLFSSTIEENIIYGNKDVSKEKLVFTCKLAKCYDFIQQLPDGFKTLVGDNGVKLSGGQRQRIAIARALLTSAQIIIFDEATSALDKSTENMINESILSLFNDKTIIVLSHRSEIINKMDKVFEVQDHSMILRR
mgnify:CR=1 FL=1